MDYEEALMVKASWYYYFENLTQQQVANQMGLTRMRVMKLLDTARQSGIIQFRLRQDGEKRMLLERKLMSEYELSDAFVVPAAVDPTLTNAGVAEAASLYISERLSDSSTINIGYGDTPSRILNNLATIAEKPLNCISLTGGVSYYLPDTRSTVFNAKLYLIPSPLMTSSKEMAEALRNEDSIRELSRMIDVAQMSVVGIGAMHESATIFKTGMLSANDFLYLRMQGAVGDVLSHFIDKNGTLLNTTMEERLISTPLEKLKELKNVIGVAAGDHKVDAIRAALNGRYLDVLVTDDRTAAQLVTATDAENNGTKHRMEG